MKFLLFLLVASVAAKSTFWDNIIPNSFEDKLAAYKESHHKKTMEDIKTEIQKIKDLLPHKSKKPIEIEPKGLFADIADKISAHKQEKIAEQVEQFEGVAQIIDNFVAEAQQQKEQREQQVQELKEQIAPYLQKVAEDIAAKKEEKKQEKQEKFTETWTKIKQSLTDFKTKIDARKEEKEAEWQQLKDKLHEILTPVILPASSAVAPSVAAAARATFLDEITGTSSWQTVTWVLLSICIVLAVALVGTILYQISQRKNYQPLTGHDNEFVPTQYGGTARKSSAV